MYLAMCFILGMILATDMWRRFHERERKNNDYNMTMSDIDRYTIRFNREYIEKYLIENLYIAKAINKVDPKELLLSKLKQK